MELLKEQYLHNKSMGNSQAARAWQGAIQLLYDMPALTPPNEWVSVEERWPEPGRRVLASCGYFVGEAWISVGGEWYRHDGFAWDNLGSDVTHWTNLPAPPERRNSNESEEET